MNRFSKKAQVTYFIIIGIVLMIAVGTFLYIREQSQPENIIDVPGRETPIYRFVDECIEQATINGLSLMSIQGGYIYIPNSVETLNIPDPQNRQITDDKLIIKGNQPNQIPYWILNTRADIPTIDYLNDELKRYVEEETMKCINNFQTFRDQGYEFDIGRINANISFLENTQIDVSFPIEATIDNSTIKIQTYQTVAPVNMKLIHDIALNIAANELAYGFVEDNTNYLISLYSGVTPDKLPPTAATIASLDGSFVTWNDNQVQQNLKQILDQGIDLIKIQGTDYTSPKEGPEQGFLFNTGLDQENIQIDFDYNPDWEFISYDVRPKPGPGISPPDRVGSSGIPFFPDIYSLSYRYKYDLQYPVLVTITDPDSENINPFTRTYEGKGFSMQIPLWIFLCGNKIRGCTSLPEYRQEIQLDPEFTSQFNYTETLFCNDDQRLSKNITVQTEPNTNLNYYCGEESCFIGQTDTDGNLKQEYPLCQNGILRLSKPGYNTKTELLTSISDEDQTLSIELEKLIPMDSEVRIVKNMDLINAYLNNNPDLAFQSASPLTLDEQAIITITGDSNIQRLYPDVLNQKLEIPTGDYQLDYLVKATMKILPSYLETIEVSYNKDGGVYDGIWITGSGDIQFTIDEHKEKIIFLTTAVKRAGEFAAVDEFQDSIFTDNGIEAELLYENNQLVAVDGMLTKDFTPEENQRVSYLNITKQEISNYLRPRLE